MIKKVISLVVLATIFTVCLPIQETYANTTGANLKALETTLTLDEAKIIVANYATNTSLSVDEAEKQLTAELESKIKEDRSEQMNQTHTTRGASSGKYKLSKSKYVGDVFYTPSSTLGIPHGHNGIYVKKDRIVESIPKTGVRNIAYNGRNVEKNTVMQDVKVSQKKCTAAANWANSQVGEKYSKNFATNRKTGKYGAKNCSKLVWSAYILKADIDIDKDKGAGVYPKDIRDSNYTHTYKTIK